MPVIAIGGAFGLWRLSKRGRRSPEPTPDEIPDDDGPVVEFGGRQYANLNEYGKARWPGLVYDLWPTLQRLSISPERRRTMNPHLIGYNAFCDELKANRLDDDVGFVLPTREQWSALVDYYDRCGIIRKARRPGQKHIIVLAGEAARRRLMEARRGLIDGKIVAMPDLPCPPGLPAVWMNISWEDLQSNPLSEAETALGRLNMKSAGN